MNWRLRPVEAEVSTFNMSTYARLIVRGQLLCLKFRRFLATCHRPSIGSLNATAPGKRLTYPVLEEVRVETEDCVTTRELMLTAQRVAEAAAARKVDATRHKCFVSYHVDDLDEVTAFLDDFGSEFIARSVGVTEDDDFVESEDPDYIKRRIREKYLTDSTVTIVLLGECTWSRRFVDWEISSSLRNDSANRRSGLLAIPLPSMNNSSHLPDRVKDNWVKDAPDESYASVPVIPVQRLDSAKQHRGSLLSEGYKSEQGE